MDHAQHPLAAALPAPTHEAYQRILEAIRTCGQSEVVVLHQHQVLSGWHTARACIELGIAARTVELPPSADPVAHLRGLGDYQDLSRSQRVMVDAALARVQIAPSELTGPIVDATSPVHGAPTSTQTIETRLAHSSMQPCAAAEPITNDSMPTRTICNAAAGDAVRPSHPDEPSPLSPSVMHYLPIDTIEIASGTQSRAQVSEATVAEYADALSDGVTLPPIVVFFDGSTTHLADGFHRLQANRRIGARTVAAEIRLGSLMDARLYAYAANQSHGLRRTNEDKRKAVQGMLADFADWSDNRIAKHVGVGNQLVGDVRRSIFVNHKDMPTTRTVERNGKTYTQDTAGQKAAGKAKAAEPADAPAPLPVKASKAAPSPAPAAPDVATSEELKSLREELAAERASHLDSLADNALMAKVFDSEDRLATAVKEVTQQRAMVATLRERVNGLMNEKNEAIRLSKYWQRKAERRTP